MILGLVLHDTFPQWEDILEIIQFRPVNASGGPEGFMLYKFNTQQNSNEIQGGIEITLD